MQQANITRVVLIRHGESEWNERNLFCGWYDAALSAKGLLDAKEISAKALVQYKMEFDCIYTSALKRAHQTLDIVLSALQNKNLPITYDWRLNERHYGDLIGYNKRQLADKYGEEQVQTWRRTFDICPPAITPENPYYYIIRNNPSFESVPDAEFPLTESLQTVMQRVIPFWEKHIAEDIKCGRRVLIIAHGTVLRALIKYLDNVSDENISRVNVPNSIPCVFEFDTETGKPVSKLLFLADENFLNKQMEKTASIGK